MKWEEIDGEYKLHIEKYKNCKGDDVIVDFAFIDNRKVAMYTCYYNGEIGEIESENVNETKNKIVAKLRQLIEERINCENQILSQIVN